MSMAFMFLMKLENFDKMQAYRDPDQIHEKLKDPDSLCKPAANPEYSRTIFFVSV
jgi:hypothetical protein